MEGFKAQNSAIKTLKGKRMKIACIKGVTAEAIKTYFNNLNLSKI